MKIIKFENDEGGGQKECLNFAVLNCNTFEKTSSEHGKVEIWAKILPYLGDLTTYPTK